MSLSGSERLDEGTSSIKFKKPQSKKPLRQRQEIAEEEDNDNQEEESVDIL